MNTDMLNKVAATVGADPTRLKTRAEEVLAEQGDAWKNAGKTEQECSTLAMRVAARQINNENASLRRSGATLYEGMFVHVPRPKEWGKILYTKMENQLKAASPEARNALVESGAVVIFEDNHDGSYTRLANESFFGQAETELNVLPKGTKQLDANTHFYVVWDKSNPTFPSGDANFKYGAPRPQDERERVALFFGRRQGSNDEWSPITVKGSGKAADVQFPTFVPGTLGMKPSRDGLTGYLNARVSQFTEDESLASMFQSPPDQLMREYLPEDFLPSLSALEDYYNEHNGGPGWWDRFAGVVCEVIHIDPRDNGGYILVCADTDMTSLADPVDVYVPEAHEHLVDFAVGTKVLITGQVWKTREDEMRISTNGWWGFDKIPPMSIESESVDTEGWDA
jgi:hypothetical protein